MKKPVYLDHNALRLANQPGKDHEQVEVRIFLMADVASCAGVNRAAPNGYYTIERRIKLAINKGTQVKICGSSAVEQGLKNAQLIEGTATGTMGKLTNWVVDSDKVATF